MIKLKIGMLYQLPHGVGKLLGQLQFENDYKSKIIPKISGNKHTSYIFKIDGNTKWSKLMNSTRYRAWGDQIQELKR